MNSGVIKASDLDRKDNSSKDKSNYKKVEIGDIAYNSMRMWQGSSGESTFRGILSPAYTVLIPNKDISSTFFSYYFKLERMLEIFKVNSQGLTSDTWNLKYPTIAKIVVSVPTLKEQIQIGNFFKQLDDTIALHQRELEKFKILKTSYLENIFLGKVSLFTAKNTITWEQCKAEDVFISISEKNHETFPVLSATQDKGMISRNEVGIDIKYDVNSLKTYKLVRKDQFVIHLRSFQGGFAHSAIDGITSPAYTILDFKDKRIHSPLFWREIFKSDFFIKRLESVIYGIRDGRSISYDEFLKLNFNYPSFEEQTQIGNFFKQLDDTIALHQRELEKFKILKTSYLENIFLGKVSLFTAKNTITWEQCKAEDVFISISEKNHETFPVLSATQDKGMISRNEVGIDIKYDVNSLKTYKLVRKDQFVIHLRSFQGGFAHSAIDGITSPAYTILDFKDKRIHSPLFWREIFKSDFFIKRLESVIYGIRDGRSISYDEFLKLNFNYPSFEEQTQIGNFFKQLDDTIALHQKELAKYQQIKTACLEKMFVE